MSQLSPKAVFSDLFSLKIIYRFSYQLYLLCYAEITVAGTSLLFPFCLGMANKAIVLTMQAY